MTPYWETEGAVLYQGHVVGVLDAMPAESIQCVMTSTPYWSLRNYGLLPIEWPSVWLCPMAGLAEVEVPGCDPRCEHEWGEHWLRREEAGWNRLEWHTGGQRKGTIPEGPVSQGQFCQRCGGWRGSLGLEPTPEMFVAHLVHVFRSVWRVLRPDGVVWLNLGDTHMGSGQGWQKEDTDSSWRRRHLDDLGRGRAPSAVYDRKDLKPKDRVCIPWRVAFALQADGWWLRQDVIWAKGVSFCSAYSGSSMPESVKDRPTTSHEYVFLLAKKRRYFYDNEAVKERGVGMGKPRPFGGTRAGRSNADRRDYPYRGDTGKRNLRSVWTINTKPFPGAHFAVFPPGLVEPCIKAGTSEKGCCPECGAPWKRIVESTGDRWTGRPTPKAVGRELQLLQSSRSGLSHAGWRKNKPPRSTTIGWCPTCSCYGELESLELTCPKCEGTGEDRKSPTGEVCPKCKGTGRVVVEVGRDEWTTKPCTVLDPFCGTGVTGEVALSLRRRFVGIELSEKYCDLTVERLSKGIQMRLPEEPLGGAVASGDERPKGPAQIRLF